MTFGFCSFVSFEGLIGVWVNTWVSSSRLNQLSIAKFSRHSSVFNTFHAVCFHMRCVVSRMKCVFLRISFGLGMVFDSVGMIFVVVSFGWVWSLFCWTCRCSWTLVTKFAKTLIKRHHRSTKRYLIEQLASQVSRFRD